MQAGVQVDIVTTDDDGPGRHLDVPLGDRIDLDGYGLMHFRKQTEFYKVSLPLLRWMRRHVQGYDLVHIHALFSFTSIAAARVARRADVPYIVRPLGVLNSWGMRNRRRLLKLLSCWLIERRILRYATAMHYTSRQEQAEAEASGACARAFIIPLGVEISRFTQMPKAEDFFAKCPRARGRKVVLFLSRIDPKKGLEILLPAFAEVQRMIPEACLVIAGNGTTDYVGRCRAIADQAGLKDVVWPGFLDGEDKLAAYAAASAFVLPSFSENFGIAAVEALAAGLPCVLSTGVAVSEDVAANGAGLVVPPTAAALKDALVRLLTDDVVCRKFRLNARRLAEEKFSIQAMGTALRELYLEVLSTRPSGNCSQALLHA